MKTYSHLYERLCSFDNLFAAFCKAKRGKSKRWDVLAFECNLFDELMQLQNELLTQTYVPQPMRKLVIHDPKTRTIHIADFSDRVIHHAIINIIGPIFEPQFIYDSHASQKMKGTHKAVQRFKKFVQKVSRNGKLVSTAFNRNHVEGYVFKADIYHYFPSIDHAILLDMLKEIIKDEKVIWLMSKLLENFSTSPGKGMPLGNYTSQFLANVYLNKFDYFVKHGLRIKYYMRYVDDFVIFHQEKRVLGQYQKEIQEYLHGLALKLHPQKSKILPLRNGVAFLGYRIFHQYMLLRKSNLRRFKRSFEKTAEQYMQGEMTTQQLKGKIQGWQGYAQWANTHNFRKKISGEVRKLVRAKPIAIK